MKVFFGEKRQERRTRFKYKHHTRLNYESRPDIVVLYAVSLGVGRPAKPPNGERGVGGKCPQAGEPSPGAGEPSVAAITGVRNPPLQVQLGGPGGEPER